MRLVAWLGVVLATACSDPSSDIVGPFTGSLHRYFVDRIEVPRDSSQAEAVAADLDGDGKADNKFGSATSVLAGINDLSLHGADMIAAGKIASFVEIHADDLTADASAGVYYLGFGGTFATDPLAVVVGGSFTGGAFTPNRTRDTRHPGAALAALPVFVNADPIGIPLTGLEIELAPDGAGGFDATVRGAVREQLAREEALRALLQMFRTEPLRHLVFLRGVDEDRDDTVSLAELEASVIGLLVSADIQLFTGNAFGAVPDSSTPDSVSIAYSMHLVPCTNATGSCATAAPQNTCRDRITDAGETDVDCGGPCQPCADGLACSVPADCQSQSCDAGACRVATCSDGVRDGFESDIDCGGACPTCATGDACAADRDCASGNCSNGAATLGSCS